MTHLQTLKALGINRRHGAPFGWTRDNGWQVYRDKPTGAIYLPRDPKRKYTELSPRNEMQSVDDARRAAMLFDNISPSDSVLDFGCGHGGLVEIMRDAGYNVDGYDPANHDMQDMTLKQQLAAELESAEREVDVFGYRVAAYRDDFARLWDIVGEEDGDRNESGVMNLAVVLERRMAELRGWRSGERQRVSTGWLQFPEPEARVCSGVAWDVCRPPAIDLDDPYPCATMPALMARAAPWPWRFCQPMPSTANHTNHCGVMSWRWSADSLRGGGSEAR